MIVSLLIEYKQNGPAVAWSEAELSGICPLLTEMENQHIYIQVKAHLLVCHI